LLSILFCVFFERADGGRAVGGGLGKCFCRAVASAC
jgi:hypothetical protein